MADKTIDEKFRQYLGQGFDEYQLEEIKLGLKDGLDVSRYARTSMPAGEMAFIRKQMNYDASLNKPTEPTYINKVGELDEEKKQDIVITLSSVAITLGEISILIAGIAIILVKLRLV